MSTAGSPAEAAHAWLAAFRDVTGRAELELREQWSAALVGVPRTVFAYQQVIDGIPVDRAIVRVVVSELATPTVSYAAGRLTHGSLAIRVPWITAAAAIDSVAARAEYRRLSFDPGAELIVYSGESQQLDPAIAWRFSGARSLADQAPERLTFFVDSTSGELRGVRNEVHSSIFYGTVYGLASGETLPDLPSNPPIYRAIPGMAVTVSGGAGDLTNAVGFFESTSDHPAMAAVSGSTAEGAVVSVQNMAGPNLLASGVFYANVNGSLVLNLVPTPTNTSQVNAFIHTNLAHDFFRQRSNLTAFNLPLTAYVNRTGMCNAFFDGAMHFFSAGATCADSAFSTVVAHEYGHAIVARLGLGQGGFGEGFADTLAMLLYQTPTIGERYYSSGASMRDPGSAGRQYPCSGSVHYCGELLAGVWWDIRGNLLADYGPAGHEIACQLFVDWAQITVGGEGNDFVNSAHAMTPYEVLTADDDNGDLSDGTPSAAAICAAFAAHGIPCPTIADLRFEYPDGLPDYAPVGESASIRVNVRPAAGAPVPGSGRLIYRNGAGYQSVAMTQLAPNEYLAVLPEMSCGQAAAYYFSARSGAGVTVTDPPAGGAAPYIAAAAQSGGLLLNEDFEMDRGWSGIAAGDTATLGRWERGMPQATVAQPGADVTLAGSHCWVTGAAAGSTAGANDVDNGITTLRSPILDLSGAVDGIVSYWRWYSNSTPSSEPHADVFDVSITNDLVNWILVERAGPTGPEAGGGWRNHQFHIRSYLYPSSTVQLRFVASDLAGSSTVEAALDEVRITMFSCDGAGCGSAGCDTDVTGDCVINLLDLTIMLTEFGLSGPALAADITGDGRVDIRDLAALLAQFGSDCR
jgi:Thermolysin metallopeptidase, catalytic domain